MVPKKEVSMLKNLSLHSMIKYLEYAAMGIVAITVEMYKHDEILGSHFLKASIEELGNNLFNSVPCHLIDAIAESITEHLLTRLMDKVEENQVKKKISIQNVLLQKRVVTKFVILLLHPKITTIEMAHLRPDMRNIILHNLHMMTGLKILNLDYFCGTDHNVGELLLLGLPYIHNLEQFHFPYECTDSIIKCISVHCKKIKTLSILDSKCVTDQSISYLKDMISLKQLFAQYTNITDKGYTKLLRKLPNIINIGIRENMATILSTVKLTGHILKLTHLDCGHLNEETLDNIVNLCPALISLNLHHVYETDISSLQELKYLKSLTLMDGNITKMKLIPYLRVYGKLECLILIRVYRIDEICLMDISDASPYLKKLTLDSCECSTSYETLGSITSKKYFSNLQSLTCHTECRTEHLIILLKSCYNVEYIEMGSRVLPNDEFITCILQHNPFSELVVFKIFFCRTLSISSVKQLIEHCPRLRFLKGLETWFLITKSEHNELHKYIQEHNLDLTFSI